MFGLASIRGFGTFEVQDFGNFELLPIKANDEYDQENPQSQTTDQPTAHRGRGTEYTESQQSYAYDSKNTIQVKQPFENLP